LGLSALALTSGRSCPPAPSKQLSFVGPYCAHYPAALPLLPALQTERVQHQLSAHLQSAGRDCLRAVRRNEPPCPHMLLSPSRHAAAGQVGWLPFPPKQLDQPEHAANHSFAFLALPARCCEERRRIGRHRLIVGLVAPCFPQGPRPRHLSASGARATGWTRSPPLPCEVGGACSATPFAHGSCRPEGVTFNDRTCG
jgi:hypothetical protein